MSKLTEGFYRLLLRLYPSEHRRDYGELMVQNFRDAHRDMTKRGHWWLRIAFWVHIFGDVAVSAFVEYREIMRENRGMSGKYGLLSFLPIVGLIFYLQAFHHDIGIGAIYAIILVSGLIGGGLSRLGMMSFSPLWRAYTLGALFGFFGIFMLILGGGISTWSNQFPAIFVAEVSIGLYIAGVFVLSYGLKPSNKVFYGATVVLPLVSFAILNIASIPSDVAPIWSAISISFVLSHAFTSLSICTICLYLMRKHGQLGVVMLLVALGTQYVFIDPAYFTGSASFGIDFIVLLFPLVVCPLWWLTAKTPQAKRWGTFALWGGFIAFAAVIPIVIRLMLGIYPDGQILLVLSRLTMALPHFIVMWIILQAAQEYPYPKLTEDIPVLTVSDAAMR